eukprot:sb/3470268/
MRCWRDFHAPHTPGLYWINNYGVSQDWSISGGVHMQISYTTPSTLHVRICAGEALAAKGGDGASSDAYVRVTLAGKYPVKTTKVVKNSLDPVWNETFDFGIPVQLLQTATVLLAVYHKRTLGADDFLGEIRVPLGEFRHFHTIDNWFPLADLKHVARHRSEWGNKKRVLRLSCPKIGQTARVVLGNGTFECQNKRRSSMIPSAAKKSPP